MLISLLFISVFADTEELLVDTTENLNNIKRSVMGFSEIEIHNKNQTEYDFFELILEQRSCRTIGKSRSWFGSKSQARVDIEEQNCLSFMGNQCNLTFKTQRAVLAKTIEFGQSPNWCAIDSFNLTMIRGTIAHPAARRVNQSMNESELRYSYELQEDFAFDRIQLNAQNSNDYLCLCGIAIKN